MMPNAWLVVRKVRGRWPGRTVSFLSSLSVGASVGLALVCLLSAGCAARKVPEPHDALRAYHRALEQQDADALYALLTADARSRVTRQEVARFVDEQRDELLERSRRLSDEQALVSQHAELFLSDGQRAELELEEGQFRLTSGVGLPAAALDPLDAVRALRAAVMSRDFDRARSALSHRASERLQAFFSSLELALADAEWGVLEVRGQHAELSLPSGRSVQLRKEEGIWKVEEVK